MPIVVMLERTARVVRRINKNALHLTGELLLQCFQARRLSPKIRRLSKRSLVGDPVRAW